jgi:hypothetical protein
LERTFGEENEKTSRTIFCSQSSGPKIKMSLIFDFVFNFAGNLFGMLRINGRRESYFLFLRKQIFEFTSFFGQKIRIKII